MLRRLGRTRGSILGKSDLSAQFEDTARLIDEEVRLRPDTTTVSRTEKWVSQLFQAVPNAKGGFAGSPGLRKPNPTNPKNPLNRTCRTNSPATNSVKGPGSKKKTMTNTSTILGLSLGATVLAATFGAAPVRQQVSTSDEWCRDENWGDDREGVCEVREYTRSAPPARRWLWMRRRMAESKSRAVRAPTSSFAPRWSRRRGHRNARKESPAPSP